MMLGCGGIGIMAASYAKFEISLLKQYISALEYMICDLRFRRSTLPELFRRTADICNGVLRKLFTQVAVQMELQQCSSAVKCVQEAIQGIIGLPKLTRMGLEILSQSIGEFDLQGQLDALEAAKAESERQLLQYSRNLDTRLRNYRSLGICAGVAIVILLI